MADVAEVAAVGEKPPSEQLLLGFSVAPRVLSLGLRLRLLPELYCLGGQVPTFGTGALVAGQAGWQGVPCSAGLASPQASTPSQVPLAGVGWFAPLVAPVGRFRGHRRCLLLIICRSELMEIDQIQPVLGKFLGKRTPDPLR